MMTESEIKMYSSKYAKMRERSVSILGGSYDDYDARNDVFLRKIGYIVEYKTGLSVDTKNPIELQCIRYLVMREIACYGNLSDIKIQGLFDALAENPHHFHSQSIKEAFAPAFIKNMTSYKNQFVELNDEAKSTIN